MPDAVPPMQIVQPAPESPGVVAATTNADGRVVIDLLPKSDPLRRCAPGRPGEIVVCATDQSEFRYKREFDSDPPPDIPGARISVGKGKTLSAEIEQAGVGGFPSNRIMMRLRIGF